MNVPLQGSSALIRWLDAFADQRTIDPAKARTAIGLPRARHDPTLIGGSDGDRGVAVAEDHHGSMLAEKCEVVREGGGMACIKTVPDRNAGRQNRTGIGTRCRGEGEWFMVGLSGRAVMW